VTWAPDCRRHDPGAEIWLGVRTPGTEVPGRVDAIRSALSAAGHPFRTAQTLGRSVLPRIHDPGLLSYLEHAHARWLAAGLDVEPGQDRVVPYLFPTPSLLDGLPLRTPSAVHALAGRYCYDTMTLVGPGTWAAAVAAADAAATAAAGVLAGDRVGYALCRPPGHHAARDGFGGSCYRDGAVLYASLHVDPGAGWFPHDAGFAVETGAGPGTGATVNEPLAPGTGDDGWLAALQRLGERVVAHRPSALVLSLGVDAASQDPESPLRVSRAAFRRAGAAVAALGLPTVAVQEGGYHLPTLGGLVAAVLEGLGGAGAPRPRAR
jgi:acetoin utilization deacetylase AcuC-like enzyme